MLEASNTREDKSAIVEDADLEAVLLCQKGDVEAFGILVEKYQKKMLNVAYRMIGDYEESCDVVQESFIAAFRAISKFRREARFSTWLYGIVINSTNTRLIQLKSTKNRLTSAEFRPDLSPGNSGCSCEGVSVPQDSVLEDLERKERDAQVQECIGLLDEGYREILVLRDIQGLSYDEIVTILQIPLGTVRSRLFRARNSLKDLLLQRMGDFS
ncbi:MAG: ECF RNA polymerase sigma-E factor [Syntrophus sp. PtaU1.Bin208]|nr:MAG: ECF RNA polymerase sigma-E factor [Syntrophus sp. PtaU1.Bin208]